MNHSWELIYCKGYFERIFLLNYRLKNYSLKYRYQSIDTITSIVTTKVKGHGYVPISKNISQTNSNHLGSFSYRNPKEPIGNYEIFDPAGI